MGTTGMTEPATYQRTNWMPVTRVTLIVVGSILLGFIIGAFSTLGIMKLMTPPPQALAAQTDTGTVLTAPACATGDLVYQAAVNGGDAKQVMSSGELVNGDLAVTVSAKPELGSNATVEAKARDSKQPQPVITKVVAWHAPASPSPNTKLAHSVVRYAIPNNTGEVELPNTKAAFTASTTVFVCVAAGPR